MNTSLPLSLLCRAGWVLATAAIACAAPAANAQMALKGKLLLDENFQHATYAKAPQPVQGGWKVSVSHADWKRTAEGVESVWTVGHMPVLKYEGDFGDAVIEVDFKFHQEPGQWAACRVSPTNPTLNPRAYAASVWANVNGTGRAPGMVLEHDEWKPGTITTVQVKPATFESDRWYTLRMELIGNYVLATCNGVTVYGTQEKFGLPKTAIYLGVGTCPHTLRNFRVYAATANPAWKAPAPAANAAASN